MAEKEVKDGMFAARKTTLLVKIFYG